MKRFREYLTEALNKKLQQFVADHPTIKLDGVDMKYVERYKANVYGQSQIVRDVYVGFDKSEGEEKFCDVKTAQKKFDAGEIDAPKSEEPQEVPDTTDKGEERPQPNTDRRAGSGHEIEVTRDVDNWIKRDEQRPSNPNIDDVVDNDEDHFYAVNTGANSSQADIMVVHDKPDGDGTYNDDKLSIGNSDKTFFVEVKQSHDSQTFNASVTINQEGDEFRYSYLGDILPSNIGDDGDKKKYHDLMTREDFGQEMTSVFQANSKPLLDTFTKIIKVYAQVHNLNAQTGFVKEIVVPEQMEFPRDFAYLSDIYDYLVRYCNVAKTDKNEFDKLLDSINIDSNKIKSIKGIDNLQKGQVQKIRDVIELVNGSLTFTRITLEKKAVAINEDELTEVEVVNNSAIDKLLGMLTSWYKEGKKVAYLEIGASDDGTDNGGIYIFDKNYDPLNLQTKFGNRVQTLYDACSKVIGIIRKEPRKNSMSINMRLVLNDNGLHFDNILKKVKMKPEDTTNDKSKFFKESN